MGQRAVLLRADLEEAVLQREVPEAVRAAEDLIPYQQVQEAEILPASAEKEREQRQEDVRE